MPPRKPGEGMDRARHFTVLNVEPEGYSPEARAIVESFAQLSDGPLDRRALLERIGDYDAVIVRLAHRIDREVLDRATRLKAIVTATTGLNHIDLEHARERGVHVLSLKGERAFLDDIHATAEHTWALLLSVLRHTPAAQASIPRTEWHRDRFRGHELHGKTLGILGCGRLGIKVAAYGLAFGMKVIVSDILTVDLGRFQGNVRQVPVEDLYANADILSIHVPFDSTTRHLVGQSALARMKPGAVLVNTARGEVVDEHALLQALESGRLSAAALDVLSGENSGNARWMETDPLVDYARRHTNLLITPHIGGATFESMEKTEIFMARKLRSFYDSIQ